MPPLTLLSTVAEFDEGVRKGLAEYWITSAEEFFGVVRFSGPAAVAQALKLPQDRITALAGAAQAVLPADVAFDALAELDVATGAIFDGMELPEAAVAFAPPTLPDNANLSRNVPPPGQQGQRNSCVAFTLAAMYQQMSGDATDLSEQFLYWACKERDGIPGDNGTRPDLAMRLLAELGICREPTWPYNATRTDQNPGHGPPPPAATPEAFQRRITGFASLPAKDFRQIQAALASGKSVLLGLPIFGHWSGTWQSRMLGRVRKPLPNERSLGGHAMCAIGYQNDASVPGGGYFIVRNSWGTDWGKDNPDGPGCAHIPYQVIFEQNMVALVIDGVVAAPNTGKNRGSRSSGRGSRGGRGSRTSATATTPPAPTVGATQDDLQALYHQAQELVATTLSNLAELNQLLARMGKLLDGTPPSAPSLPPPNTPPNTPPTPTPKPGDSPAATSAGPLVIVRGAEVKPPSSFLPNGVLATTGDYLLKIDSGGASEIARSTDLSDRQEVFLAKLHQAKIDSGEAHKGLAFGDENKPQEAGWALVVHADDDAALIKALSPLIEKRCRDQGLAVPALDVRDGETCGAWLTRKVQNVNAPMQSGVPVLLYNTGESVPRFLARHGTSVGPVKPELGVPFYLLLAARPGAPVASDTTVIPFEFQYELDIFWGVGRLCFTDPKTGQHTLNAYSDYAEQVVAFEGLAQPPYGKHIAYFGTRHDFDLSTQRSADELVQPLFAGNRGKALAERFGFSQQLLLGQEATRSGLDALLRGKGERPAILFTATHGIGFPADDERLAAQQGALVCQDWSGIGNISREHWFAAEDVSASSNVSGLIAVCFACYGVGCPQVDQFVFTPGRDRPQIAPFPLVAQLPQQLLARGALAVLGHVDRAWTHSFSAPGVPAQTQGFESVLGRLMQGGRLGRATDQFNMLQGAVSARLTEELEKNSFGKNVKTDGLAALWAARNDARNYALLGDPMVKLPF